MIRCIAFRLCAVLLLLASLNSNAQTIQIPLSGVGDVPSSTSLSVNPALLENGEVKVGAQQTQQFAITHNGAADDLAIEILSVEVGGQDSYDFISDYVGYNTLNAGQSFDFSVTFSPVTLGYKKAFLRIEHSGENSPHLVLMTGIGIDVPASQLKITDNDLGFGTLEVDKTTNKTLTLTNAGGNRYPAINIFNATIAGDNAGDFSTNFGNTITLNPGQSESIVVTMTSTIAGQKNALLSIDHDGSNPTIRVSLKGAIELATEPEPVVDDQGTPNPTTTPTPGGLTKPDFLTTSLNNASPKNPTSIQFGPNGNLYVAERDGFIWEYEVDRTNTNTYNVTNSDKIGLIYNMTNRNDDGSVNNSVNGRLVTGILVAGTAGTPEIYVASSDPRQAAGPSGNDSNLDTNSVIISRLTKNGGNWSKKDLVRGLPRSEENHVGNGMQLSNNGNTLYISMGGHTNMGLPSNNFARLPEYALSAAIVEVNLNQIGNNTYDLPTLDDEDRPGAADNNDPFGGNNGKNMAILETNGPVSIYAPGFRNAYDLLITESGRMYTVDNGPNSGWGDQPAANCLGTYKDGGNTFRDGLHYIENKGYYGGHPNPTRGSKNNKFNDSNPQSPIQGAANPIECSFKKPVSEDKALHIFNSSTNGLAEYTASNFSGSMKGDLLAASFNQSVFRVQLNNKGDKLVGIDKLFTNLSTPLDVTTQGDNDVFPGTVWVADYAKNSIEIYEPKDYQ